MQTLSVNACLNIGTNRAQCETLELVMVALCCTRREVGLNQFKVDSDVWRVRSTGLGRTNEQHFGGELEI